MDAIARQQGMERWADNTPLHVLFIPEIKKTIPDAKSFTLFGTGEMLPPH